MFNEFSLHICNLLLLQTKGMNKYEKARPNVLVDQFCILVNCSRTNMAHHKRTHQHVVIPVLLLLRFASAPYSTARDLCEQQMRAIFFLVTSLSFQDIVRRGLRVPGLVLVLLPLVHIAQLYDPQTSHANGLVCIDICLWLHATWH